MRGFLRSRRFRGDEGEIKIGWIVAGGVALLLVWLYLVAFHHIIPTHRY